MYKSNSKDLRKDFVDRIVEATRSKIIKRLGHRCLQNENNNDQVLLFY